FTVFPSGSCAAVAGWSSMDNLHCRSPEPRTSVEGSKPVLPRAVAFCKRSKDAMNRDEGRRSFPAISFVQVVVGRKGDTVKWIEHLTPELLRIGSSAPWS